MYEKHTGRKAGLSTMLKVSLSAYRKDGLRRSQNKQMKAVISVATLM
jgi:hypothetical protein